ncbi:hypothetical protein IID62_02405, partial [candidate division KSB1 bacterium]|nr:hypothetical protein [candidate division KSB1 bacterium]
TGEYPTSVKLSNNQLIVTNRGGGKDSSEDANSKDRNNAGERGNPGTVSFIQIPDNARLSEYTQRVRKNNGYVEMADRLEFGVTFREPRAIPRMQGEATLIRYVFYIIKGNLNYEQVFGDLRNRTGNVETPVFGRAVTPNYHALTEKFVLYDNFYVNGATRGEGLEWSTAATVTDFIMSLAPVHSYNRGFPYPAEGVFPIASPDAGYIWDAANQKDLTYNLYGLFVSYLSDRKSSLTANLENLKGHFSPDYPPFDVNFPDTERAEIFIKDFDRQAAGNSIPKLNILYLPHDHLDRDFADDLEVSRVAVTDSDQALGMIVEAISNSRIWQESVIFVVQGSSQTGYPADNRSIALAISPYSKRGFVDRTLYDTSSIVRSIGLILGLLPLSQSDLSATPLHNGFQQIALLEPYTAK